MKDFTLLAVFTFPHEYAILRLLFDQEGIRYVFQNETMIGVFPFYSNALGGIKLKVHKEDLQRSKEILESLDDTSTPLRIV
ncbi:Putative signal transducing protein [Salinimicrobium catena]|uniref:Putative signal transducing protein n=1 Tax=Salinimicrobium catena TaxID=390640 RepID=A0A1H5IKA3_9FLAO|nr:hypothetical protein [Salinimicrobium catena]SDK78437.1 Putative signal transducing protein [Salinimicrobium catena]SEE40666.1 Putative signal transducing protein [Salinimicrobium catena]